MKSFKDIQEMARKNPDLNPRIPAFQQLEKYNTKDYFFSFTSLKRIGIRPTSPHETPNGIYCFPATIMDTLSGSMSNVPYVGEMPYIHVLKKKGRGIVDPLESYSSSDLKRDMKKIWKILNTEKTLPLNPDGIEHVERIIKEAKKTAKVKTPIGIFWNITRMISLDFGYFFGWGGVQTADTKEWYTDYDKWEPYENSTNSQMKAKKERRKRKKRSKRKGKMYTRTGVSANAQGWNNLLRRLGYQGFVDRSRSGIIHPNEPIAAVFLSIKAFDVVDMIESKGYENLNRQDDTKKHQAQLEKKHNKVRLVGYLPFEDTEVLSNLASSDIRGCSINYYKGIFEISGGGKVSNLTLRGDKVQLKDITIDSGTYMHMDYIEECIIKGGDFYVCDMKACEIIKGNFSECTFPVVDVISNAELIKCKVDQIAFFNSSFKLCTIIDCSFASGCAVNDSNLKGKKARLVFNSDSIFYDCDIKIATMLKGHFQDCIIEEAEIKGATFEKGMIQYSIIKAGKFRDVKMRLNDVQGGDIK